MSFLVVPFHHHVTDDFLWILENAFILVKVLVFTENAFILVTFQRKCLHFSEILGKMLTFL